MNEVIIALGCNDRQEERMVNARRLLVDVFGDGMVFSRDLWTEPIGIQSDRFLNCVGKVTTRLTQNEVTAVLKHIESECGNTTELRHKNIIAMDVDLLVYGGVMQRPEDMERSYIKELLTDLHLKNL